MEKIFDSKFWTSSKADHGWEQNVNVCWIKEPFTKDIEEILINDENNGNEVNVKSFRVTKRATYSQSRRIKREFISKGHLQNFKNILDFHTQNIPISFVD